MKLSNRFVSPEEKAHQRKIKQARKIGQMIAKAEGSPGVVWTDLSRGALVMAIHDGEGLEGQYAACSLSTAQLVSLIDKLLLKLPPEDAAKAVHRETWHKQYDLQRELDQLRGEAQQLRWRIHHLEADAATRVPAHSDATALVPFDGGKERAS